METLSGYIHISQLQAQTAMEHLSRYMLMAGGGDNAPHERDSLPPHGGRELG